MSKKEDALYKAWVSETKSNLVGKPEKLKAFETLIADGDDDPEGREVFRGGLREADYYRRLTEHKDKEKELEDERRVFASREAEVQKWYEENSPKNEQLQKEKRVLEARLSAAREQLQSLGLEDEVTRINNVQSVNAAPDNSDIEKMKKQLSTIERGLPGLLSQFGDVLTKVNQEKWKVSPAQIIDFSSKHNVDLKTAFDRLTVDEQTERTAKEAEELKKKWKEEGRREALSQGPTPDRHRASGPSILETIQNPSDANSRRAGAMKDYLEMADAGGL